MTKLHVLGQIEYGSNVDQDVQVYAVLKKTAASATSYTWYSQLNFFMGVLVSNM